MNFKTTYILFGILIVLIGVVALALWYDPNARNDKNKYVLPALQDKDSIKPTDIDRVEEIRRRDKEKIVLMREPSSEQLVDDRAENASRRQRRGEPSDYATLRRDP